MSINPDFLRYKVLGSNSSSRRVFRKNWSSRRSMLTSTTTGRCVNTASRLIPVESHYPSIKTVGNFKFTEHILSIGQSEQISYLLEAKKNHTLPRFSVQLCSQSFSKSTAVQQKGQRSTLYRHCQRCSKMHSVRSDNFEPTLSKPTLMILTLVQDPGWKEPVLHAGEISNR